MWIAEALLLGAALSMDAFAVTIANAFGYSSVSHKKLYLAPVAFAVFQGLMPSIGYLLGSFAAGIIMKYHGIVTLVILGFIGGNMCWEGIKELRGVEPENDKPKQKFTVGVVIMQAIATSIDALAVGVAYAASEISIIWFALIIALTTLLFCTIAWLIGIKFGEKLGARAQLVGGIVLVCIGLKAMFF